MAGKNIKPFLLLLAALQISAAASFQAVPPFAVSPRVVSASENPGLRRRRAPSSPRTSLRVAKDEVDTIDLKAELIKYLKTREEANADAAAEGEVGKVIGGTRGNAILEYVSGSPNKMRIQESAPDPFDYDELTKYGYSNLVTPIMRNGGRRAMYALVDMPEPALSLKLSKPKSAPKLIIDRTGETDDARYTGLKMTQMLDDEEMGRALAEATRKTKEGKSLRKRLVEEDYVQPYADKRNVGPQETPIWTAEKIDEAGRKAGQAQAWARRARMGELKTDPYERLVVEGGLRAYSIAATVIAAVAFGNSSPAALEMVRLGIGADWGEGGMRFALDALKFPAAAMLLAAAGSGVANGVFFAPPKKRSSFVWAVKGFFGGPLSVLQLRELEELRTIGESEKSPFSS